MQTQHLNLDLEVITPSHHRMTKSTLARNGSKSAVKLPVPPKRYSVSPNIGFYSTVKNLPKKDDCDESKTVI